MKRIVILDAISEDAVRRLAEETGWAVEERLDLPPDELPQHVEDADVLIVRSTTQLTAEVIKAAKRLKVIGRAGIGVDNIDLEAASEHEVRVVNAPGATTTSVAELTVGAILSLARWIPAADASMKAGRWERESFVGFEIKGKLLGLLGFGRIGREVAALAQGLGMRVVASDPYLEGSHVQGVRLRTLDDVLQRADFVSLHMPMQEGGEKVLTRKRLEMMKRGAFLLNLGRGGLIDEAATADLLESGHLGGVALDTYESEPPGESIDRIRRHPRSLLLPHIGARTREGQARMGMELVDAVAKAIRKHMSARAAALARAKEEAVEAEAEAARASAETEAPADEDPEEGRAGD